MLLEYQFGREYELSLKAFLENAKSRGNFGGAN